MMDAADLKKYGFLFPQLARLGYRLNQKTGRFPLPVWLTWSRHRTMGVLAELFGPVHADRFWVIHQAQKTVLGAGLFLVFSLFSAFGGFVPEIWLLGSVLVGLAYCWPDLNLKKKLQKRKRMLLLDLPGFLNTLVLLINAGLPYHLAVERIVRDSRSDRPLYEELRQVLTDLESGRSARLAYEQMVLRCRLPEITRMATAILQNLNRGGSGMLQVLMELDRQAWTRRKDLARRAGEEASTKLIVPMVMVFAAISIMVLAPAVLTMSR